MMQIAESVTRFHPDKICDQISDAILDACLEQDPLSRVAVETIGGHGTVMLIGEVTTKADVDFSTVARDTYSNLTGKIIGVVSNIVRQAPEIAQGVIGGGAGDQGIMIGYACRDNELYIPKEVKLCRDILQPFTTDGKSQVVLQDGKIQNIVLSVQGKDSKELEIYLKEAGFMGSDPMVYCNNTGSFEVGGFDADSGCTGRKIVVDAYGPRVPVGGGAFSGKDPTKVDRSGAYMARWIALQLLHKYGAEEVLVKLGYVIGNAIPVVKKAIINGEEVFFDYDCRPDAIIEQFDLRKPIYLQTAAFGHFGNRENPWEKV